MRGLVTDSSGELVAGAAVRVTGRNKDVLTSQAGEYWRVLVPGTYRIKAIKDDMESEEVNKASEDRLMTAMIMWQREQGWHRTKATEEEKRMWEEKL